jgi:hypothetical protein
MLTPDRSACGLLWLEHSYPGKWESHTSRLRVNGGCVIDRINSRFIGAPRLRSGRWNCQSMAIDCLPLACKLLFESLQLNFWALYGQPCLYNGRWTSQLLSQTSHPSSAPSAARVHGDERASKDAAQPSACVLLRSQRDKWIRSRRSPSW